MKIQILDEAQRDLIDGFHFYKERGGIGPYFLYAERLEGIKRSESRTYRYDRAHWLADRRRMFDRPQHVALGAPEIEQFGDEARITFYQEWQSTGFADRGRKQMVLVLDGDQIKIRSEEMLTSAVRPLSP